MRNRTVSLPRPRSEVPRRGRPFPGSALSPEGALPRDVVSSLSTSDRIPPPRGPEVFRPKEADL
jgi:hypothetical protein